MSDDSARIVHFTYGSNMCSRFLKDYCPSAERLSGAVLPNWQIVFRYYSAAFEGGISSIIPAPGHLVRGALFSIRRAEIEALDILESVPQGIYLRETFLVLDDAGLWQKGDLYLVAKPGDPVVPSSRYLDILLEGAREQGLPKDYIADLAARRGKAIK